MKLTEWIITLGESDPDALSDAALDDDALGDDSFAESVDPR